MLKCFNILRIIIFGELKCKVIFIINITVNISSSFIQNTTFKIIVFDIYIGINSNKNKLKFLSPDNFKKIMWLYN